MGGVPERRPPGAAPARLASDAERERATRSLRRHYAAGRLDDSELERRLELAVSARTRAELAALFSDLPSGRGRRLARANRAALRAHGAGYAAGNGLLVGVWALTGGGDFWPAWALVPTTGLLVWHAGVSYLARSALGRRRR